MKKRRRPESTLRPDRDPAPVSEDRPARGRIALLGAAAALIVFLAYSNHFRNSFHFDDGSVIQNNAYLRTLRNVPLFFQDASTFSSHPQNATYRPLTSVSFALDYWRTGRLDPFGFHVTQWSLHLLLGTLVFFFLLRILALAGFGRERGPLALFGAALFCLHTLNTETVNFLTLRSEILSTAGVIGSFVAYQYAPRLRRTYLWLLPAVLGFFAKQSAMMFAPLFALYMLLFTGEHSGFGRGSRSERLRLFAPIAAPFLLAAAFYVLQRLLGGPALIYGSTPPWVYLQTQVFAWLHYVRLFLLPMGLSADGDWSPIEHAYDTRVIAGALFALFLIGASIRYWRRRPAGRAVLYGVLWFYVALIPSSSVFPLSEMINEHRPYLPLIGLILAATAAGADAILAARRRRLGTLLHRAAPAACVLILALHAAGTYARNRVWATDETLWRSVTEASPRNARAWMNYGLVFMARADYANARRCFERARESAPNYDVLEVNFGILDAATGNPGEAERHFQRAISLKSNIAMAHHYYGRWLSESGRLDEATRQLELAVRQSPADLSARHLLLDVYEKRGDDPGACSLARETLTVAPGDSRAADALQRRCRAD